MWPPPAQIQQKCLHMEIQLGAKSTLAAFMAVPWLGPIALYRTPLIDPIFAIEVVTRPCEKTRLNNLTTSVPSLGSVFSHYFGSCDVDR